MKRLIPIAVILALASAVFFSTETEAATQFTTLLNLKVPGKLLLGTTTETGNGMTKVLGASATVDFASTYSGVVLSSSITVTGARAGDPCFVGVPTAAAALKAKFGCYVDAADSVKVWFSPEDSTDGTVNLSSGTPSTATATVVASSLCGCDPVGTTAAIAAAGCATSLSSTTLTVTGPNTVTTTINYHCIAPVDPASGTYYVRVISGQ